MKPVLQFSMAIIAVTILFSSCKKDKKNNSTNDLPDVINNIITQSQIDSLKKHGVIINEGKTPPTIAGAFLVHPDVCTFDNSGDNAAGTTFDDYAYKLSSQDNSKFTIRLDYSDVGHPGTDVGSDVSSTFVSGSGTAFTVFAQSSGTEAGITYKRLEILSGIKQDGGVANLQSALYIQEKGADPTGVLAPVGTTRVFYDSDKFSEDYTGTIQMAGIQKNSKSLSRLKSLKSASN